MQISQSEEEGLEALLLHPKIRKVTPQRKVRRFLHYAKGKPCIPSKRSFLNHNLCDDQVPLNYVDISLQKLMMTKMVIVLVAMTTAGLLMTGVLERVLVLAFPWLVEAVGFIVLHWQSNSKRFHCNVLVM